MQKIKKDKGQSDIKIKKNSSSKEKKSIIGKGLKRVKTQRDHLKKALNKRSVISLNKAVKDLKPEISSFKSFLDNLWQSEGDLNLKIGITLLSTCLFAGYVAYNKTALVSEIVKSIGIAKFLLIASVCFGFTAFAYS